MYLKIDKVILGGNGDNIDSIASSDLEAQAATIIGGAQEVGVGGVLQISPVTLIPPKRLSEYYRSI